MSNAVAETADEVKQTWDSIKQTEKASHPKPTHYLDEVPSHMPAMLEAFKLGQRAARVGFDWPDVGGLFDKLAEEAAELRTEVDRTDQSKIEEEFGDLLFTAVNLARHLKLEPEFALRAANRKFRSRFNSMESAVGIEMLKSATPDELETLWRGAKQSEG
jgi:XTP/dITP diphosphohydrolase/ATP diphosphatase